MRAFDPLRDIVGAGLIADAGLWPGFHDARVNALRFWRGDIRPDDDVWIGPTIEAEIETSALEVNFLCRMKFHDCDAVKLEGFAHGNDVLDLTFNYEARGFYLDGVTPLPPFIRVEFIGCGGPEPMFTLAFRCFKVEILDRLPLTDG
ncbi:hypothetical protein [Methylocystis parvus]|uniref:hypothetical protein n=1 Tax=Methylocystis parvus TaxID=134 RepID=UPI003C722F06